MTNKDNKTRDKDNTTTNNQSINNIQQETFLIDNHKRRYITDIYQPYYVVSDKSTITDCDIFIKDSKDSILQTLEDSIDTINTTGTIEKREE